jgi:hypothetical protein
MFNYCIRGVTWDLFGLVGVLTAAVGQSGIALIVLTLPTSTMSVFLRISQLGCGSLDPGATEYYQ